MDFGLQDEVGGTFGDWVTFDDLEKIERKYPELIEVVKDTMLGGWGFSQNTATRIIDKKGKASKSNSPERKKSSSAFSVVMLLIICVAGGSAYYLARYSNWGAKLFKMSRTSPSSQFEKLLRSGDKSSFINQFQGKLPNIIKDARKSQSNLKDWLPSMRAYAFLTKGVVPGVSSKIIRGDGFDKAPQNCSLTFWKNEWSKSKTGIGDFASTYPASQRLENWQKVLLWDPYWIARRSAYEEWIFPKNYYHACLIMAQKGFDEIYLAKASDEANTKSIEMVRSRLNQLVEIVNSGRAFAMQTPAQPTETSETQESLSMLKAISCLDELDESKSKTECFVEANVPSTWQKYLAYRDKIAKVRLQIEATATKFEKEDLRNISKDSSVLSRHDSITGLHYDAESRYIRNLIRNDGNVTQSVNELKYDHQNVNVLIGH